MSSVDGVPGFGRLPAPAQARLRRWVIEVLRRDDPAPDYDRPLGDPGLFGPHSVTWKIHADFPSMMAGGICALMLQALHPLALAGVWDHSNFRGDTLGRLRRTTAFVARTTYAPRSAAERAIERVRAIHRRVRGVAPDGRAYAAEDPHLLTWVHCTEAWSFLRGYEVYCSRRPLPTSVRDRYLRETARVAEALGARRVPQSQAQLDAFLRRVRGELVYDARTREVLEVLERIRLPIPLAGVGRRLFLGAGAALLPDWGLALIPRSRIQRVRDAAAARSMRWLAPALRAALAEGGIAARACLRVGADYAGLFRWPDDER